MCIDRNLFKFYCRGIEKINKQDELSHLHATGFCSTPDFTRSSKKSVYVFVNNRVVKCPVILKAIDTAYKNMLPAGKYPFVCLNLSIPAKDVDVNVHPTKKEVRYQNPNQIFNFIYSSILGALADIKVPQKEEPDIVIPFGNYNTLQTTTQDGVSQDKEDDDTVYVSSQKFEEIQETNTPPASRQFELNIKQIDLDIPKIAQVEETFNIIGQYQNTYIIFEEDTELK